VDSSEFYLLVGLIVFYVSAGLDVFPASQAELTIVGALLFAGLMVYGAVRALRRWPASIWGALFWVRIACAVYYGFGCIVPFIDNDAMQNVIRGGFYFSDAEALKFGMICASGVLCIYLGAMLFELMRRRKQVAANAGRQFPLELLALAFLVLGGAIRYGVVVPFLFGFGEGILTSVVSMLARGYTAGLILLLILGLRRKDFTLVLAVILVAIELFVGVLLFTKADVLITCLAVLLALVIHRPKVSTFLVGVPILVYIFLALTPVVTFGREQLIGRLGAQVASLDERINLLVEYDEARQTISQERQAVEGFTRFSYTNVATVVVARYDNGAPIRSVEYILAAIVPRFLWPNKPDISSFGTDLYTLVTGGYGSSISPGIFAEAYGNYGWLGLPIFMIPLGLVMAALSFHLSRRMEQKQWQFLPIVLLGVLCGSRMDGSIVGDYVGTPFTIFLLYLVFSFGTKIFGRSGPRSSPVQTARASSA
jgi:hypothetical protein